eukprot:GABV01001657.1.p1 GENE.GABV01001657.1~~GABV01001657.1.p1  ORF type:complete len:113 (-),score=18.30 GABV01001657.1:128-466(-)
MKKIEGFENVGGDPFDLREWNSPIIVLFDKPQQIWAKQFEYKANVLSVGPKMYKMVQKRNNRLAAFWITICDTLKQPDFIFSRFGVVGRRFLDLERDEAMARPLSVRSKPHG